MNSDSTSEIVIYRTKHGKSQLEVRLKEDTLWLDAHQMAEVFERDRSVIVRHIRNVYSTGELNPSSTCAKNAQVAADGKIRQMDLYNLDMILSVGYRVNSKRGTQFRIWATNVLKQHLIEGYTLNEKRLKVRQESYHELLHAVELLGRIVDHRELPSSQGADLIRVVRDFAYGLDLIDAYDHQRLSVEKVSRQKARPISYEDARQAIEQLRQQYRASDLFGREKDKSFQGSLVSIFQTFGKRQLYPSIEEKAANLL